jgi:hypothetical protein
MSTTLFGCRMMPRTKPWQQLAEASKKWSEMRVSKLGSLSEPRFWTASTPPGRFSAIAGLIGKTATMVYNVCDITVTMWTLTLSNSAECHCTTSILTEQTHSDTLGL